MTKGPHPAAKTEVRKIRDKAFAKRIAEACDLNPLVPPYNYGRLTWIRDQMESKYRERVSVETVRKWFAGEARPRPVKMKKLAALLGVDEGWLSLGLSPEMQPEERRAFSTQATGAVNVVAGLIQLAGWSPAFPESDNPRAKNANLIAIIEGRSRHLYVTLAVDSDTGMKFTFPTDHEHTTVIGVIPTGPLRCDFIHFKTEALDKHAERRGGFSEITVKKNGNGYVTKREQWNRIKTFADPF